MEKFVKFYNCVIGDMRFLGVAAFLFSAILFGNWGFKVFSIALFGFIYALKIQKQVEFKHILKFGLVFTIIDFIVNFINVLIAFFSNTQVSTIRYCQIKLIMLLALDVVAAFIVFYLISVFSAKLIDKFSANEKANKIFLKLQKIFVTSPALFLALIILGVVSFKIYNYITLESGKFIRAGNYLANLSEKIETIPFEDDKVIIFVPALMGMYQVFDSKQMEVVESGNLKGFKHYYRDVDLARLNKNEILILSEESIVSKHKNKGSTISLGILNTDGFKFKNLGEFKVETGSSLTAAQVGENKVLIAGGKGRSKQAYIFDGNVLERINDLKYGYINPIILPFRKNEYIIAGKIDERDGSSVFAAEVFNIKDKTFRNVLKDIVYHTGFASVNLYNIFLENNKIIFFYKNDRLKKVLHNFNAETFKKIREIELPLSPYSETITWLKNGKILITGGLSTPLTLNSQAYFYDIYEDKIKRLYNKIEVPRFYGRSLLLNNGSVILYGGNIEEYNRTKPLELFIPWKK